MTKNEILEKVNELISAPSVCAKVKEAAQAYVKSQDKKLVKSGDKITYTTKLGTRSYTVCSVAKISVDDLSVLNDSAENIITLVTCVMDQPSYRWCIQAKATA